MPHLANLLLFYPLNPSRIVPPGWPISSPELDFTAAVLLHFLVVKPSPEPGTISVVLSLALCTPLTSTWIFPAAKRRARARQDLAAVRSHSGHLQRPLRDAIDLAETTSCFTAWRRNPWSSLPSTRTTGVTCASSAKSRWRHAELQPLAAAVLG